MVAPEGKPSHSPTSLQSSLATWGEGSRFRARSRSHRGDPSAEGSAIRLPCRQVSVKERHWRKAEDDRRPGLDRKREPSRKPGFQ